MNTHSVSLPKTVCVFKFKLQFYIDWNSTATGVIDNGEDIVDVILCPASPGVAPPLDCSRYWGYTSQWNLLDYPALVFPVTTVDPALDARDDDYLPKNEQDQYNHDLCKFSTSLYTISIETNREVPIF